MNKNKEQLDSFTKYCQDHPFERFWQALRNWAGYSFIYGSKVYKEDDDLQDTFYK